MKLLLIHAFPLDAAMWDDLAPIPVERVAPHLPGFGGTPGVGPVLHMSEAARSCAAALDGEPALVCGLSMGGYVALELWRSRPDLVAGLVLANTRAEADDAAGRDKRLGLAQRLDEEGSDFLVAQPPPLLGPDAPQHLQERVRNLIAAQPAASIAAAARGMAERPDSTGDLPGIDVPTLVITSSHDELIPQAVSAPMAEHIPTAELAVIEGVGHLSNLEAPEVFAELLAGHVARCR